MIETDKMINIDLSGPEINYGGTDYLASKDFKVVNYYGSYFFERRKEVLGVLGDPASSVFLSSIVGEAMKVEELYDQFAARVNLAGKLCEIISDETPVTVASRQEDSRVNLLYSYESVKKIIVDGAEEFELSEPYLKEMLVAKLSFIDSVAIDARSYQTERRVIEEILKDDSLLQETRNGLVERYDEHVSNLRQRIFVEQKLFSSLDNIVRSLNVCDILEVIDPDYVPDYRERVVSDLVDEGSLPDLIRGHDASDMNPRVMADVVDVAGGNPHLMRRMGITKGALLGMVADNIGNRAGPRLLESAKNLGWMTEERYIKLRQTVELAVSSGEVQKFIVGGGADRRIIEVDPKNLNDGWLRTSIDLINKYLESGDGSGVNDGSEVVYQG